MFMGGLTITLLEGHHLNCFGVGSIINKVDSVCEEQTILWPVQ